MPLFEIYEDPEKGMTVRRGTAASNDIDASATSAASSKKMSSVGHGLYDSTNKPRHHHANGGKDSGAKSNVWSKQMAEKLIDPPKRSNASRVSPPPVGTAVRSAPPLPPRSPPTRIAPPEPHQRAPSPPPDATCDATKWLGTIFARPDSITARLNDSKKERGASGSPPSQRVQSPHPVEVNSDRAPSPRAEATQDVTWWECDYCGLPFSSLQEAQAHEDACSKTSNNPKRDHELSPIPELQAELRSTPSPSPPPCTNAPLSTSMPSPPLAASAYPMEPSPAASAYPSASEGVRTRLFAALSPKQQGGLSDSPTHIISSAPDHREAHHQQSEPDHRYKEPRRERSVSRTPPPAPARSPQQQQVVGSARRSAATAASPGDVVDASDVDGVRITATVVYGDAAPAPTTAHAARSPGRGTEMYAGHEGRGTDTVPRDLQAEGRSREVLEALLMKANEEIQRANDKIAEQEQQNALMRDRQKLNERRNAQLRADLSAMQDELSRTCDKLSEAQHLHEKERIELEGKMRAISAELGSKASQANNLGESLRLARARLRLYESASGTPSKSYAPSPRSASLSPAPSSSPPLRPSASPSSKIVSLPPPPPQQAKQWWPSKSTSSVSRREAYSPIPPPPSSRSASLPLERPSDPTSSFARFGGEGAPRSPHKMALGATGN